MGWMSGLLGVGGGAGGTGFSGPQLAQITDPVTGQQLSGADTQNQADIASQQKLLQALQSQNGLGNQNQVYGQLQGIANGTGPNPAMAQLNQTTAQNIANQGAMAAGQRGASSNVGLLARSVGQQGAATQQQAVGQGATMAANQELGAIQAAGNLANTQAANQIGQTNANQAAGQGYQNSLLNAQGQYNGQQVQNQASVNAANAGLAQTTMSGQQGLLGGLLNAGGSAAKLAAGAKGGMVKMANGGPVDGSAFPTAQSKFGQFLSGLSPQGPTAQQQSDANMTAGGSKALQQGTTNLANGLISAMRSNPQKQQLTAGADNDTPGAVDYSNVAAKGGNVHDYRATGGKVNAKNSSEKAVKKGNSYSNDKIPALLSEGETVIPRSVMQSRDPVNGAAKFVAAVLAKKGRK